jgi:hypothetical protein
MKKIYYEKRGRRYYPVAEYDSNLFNSMSKGNHLVMCYPGGHSIRYDIDPDYAAMIAAGRVAETAMSDAIRTASEMRPKRAAFTEEQRTAWEHLITVFGDDARMLQWPAARDIAETAVKALQEEANKLLTNPAARLAYDHFQMVAELTKEHDER